MPIKNRTQQHGALTQPSAPATADQEFTPPAAPTGLSATAGDTEVVLDWNNNSESDAAKYNVYRGTSSGVYALVTTITGSTNSAYTNTGLTNDTQYFFVVTCLDASNNESSYSSEVNATPVLGCVATTSKTSLRLDGTDEYLRPESTTPGSQILSTTDWTIWATIRVSENDTYGTILCKGKNDVGDVQFRWYLREDSWGQGRPYPEFEMGGTVISLPNWCYLSQQYRDPTGRFYSIGITHRGSTNSFQAYFRGLPQGTAITPTISDDACDDRKMQIGARWATDGTNTEEHLEAIIGDLAIWEGKELTAAEMLAINGTAVQLPESAHSGWPVVPRDLTSDFGDYESSDDLTSYYRFGDGTESTDSAPATIYDMSDNDYHMIAQNYSGTTQWSINKGPFGPAPEHAATNTKRIAFAAPTANYAEAAAASPLNDLKWDTPKFTFMVEFEITNNASTGSDWKILGITDDTSGTDSGNSAQLAILADEQSSSENGSGAFQVYAKVGKMDTELTGDPPTSWTFKEGDRICLFVTWEMDINIGGSWHQDQLCIYLHGYLLGRKNNATGYSVPSAYDLANFFDGSQEFEFHSRQYSEQRLYRVAAWDAVLSQEEMWHIWNLGEGADPRVNACGITHADDLIVYIPCEEGSGDTAEDVVAADGDLTLNNPGWDDI